MLPLKQFRSPERRHPRWYILVVVVATLTLTGSLATRTSTPRISRTITTQSQSSSSVRQHLNGDAIGWNPPVASVVISETPSFYPRVSPAGPPIPSLLFEENLYNRPPPSC